MPARKKSRPTRRAKASASKGGFVGRDASPVLDKYPAKDPSLSPRGPPPTPPAPKSVPAPSPSAPAAPTAASGGAATLPLITLERPFDVDEFSTMLGETSLRVTVPREDLPEVLRRVVEFMGFGIYVYSISVRPAPSDLLKAFVLELRRVDFSAPAGDWVPFVEQGASDSPFGPSGTRT